MSLTEWVKIYMKTCRKVFRIRACVHFHTNAQAPACIDGTSAFGVRARHRAGRSGACRRNQRLRVLHPRIEFEKPQNFAPCLVCIAQHVAKLPTCSRANASNFHVVAGCRHVGNQLAKHQSAIFVALFLFRKMFGGICVHESNHSVRYIVFLQQTLNWHCRDRSPRRS